MAWIRVDDHFDEHPKLAKIGPLGWGMWLAGLAYCNRNLTDGFIPWTKARTLASFETLDGEDRIWTLSRTCGMTGDDIDANWVINLLVDAELWEVVDGGFQIHDYNDYQPTKAEIEEQRTKKSAAGQAGGRASVEARAQAKAKQVLNDLSTESEAKSNPKPNPNPKPIGSDEPITEPPLSPKGEKRKSNSTKPFVMPDDFTLTDERIAYAENKGMARAAIENLFEEMRLWSRMKGGKYLDWDAAWQTWVRRRIDESPPNVQPIRPPVSIASKPQLPPVMQPGSVPPDGGLAAWRSGNTGG